MRKIETKEQLKKVASNCSQYTPKEASELKSSSTSSGKTSESCTKCTHYNQEGKCNLDLIDPILSSFSSNTDLNS